MDWKHIYANLQKSVQLVDDIPNMPNEKFEVALMDAQKALMEAREIASAMKLADEKQNDSHA